MPRRKWKLRLRHILDAIDKIRVYTADMSLAAFSANDLVVDAVLRNFMVIGEATRHIPTHVTTALSPDSLAPHARHAQCGDTRLPKRQPPSCLGNDPERSSAAARTAQTPARES